MGFLPKDSSTGKIKSTAVNFIIFSGMTEPNSLYGFLPHAEGPGGEVKIGKLLQGLVRSIDKVRKVVYLSSDPDTISKSLVWFLCDHSIVFLVPNFNDSHFPF